METNINEIEINGVKYVKKGLEESKLAVDTTGLPYVIARTDTAGAFAGYLQSKNGKEVVIKNSRRIWYWDGAASLSELATLGTSKPENCKFPCVVEHTELTEVVEIIHCTEKARQSIEGVKVWTLHE